MATQSSNLMDRGGCWATGHGVTRVRHDLATKPPPACTIFDIFESSSCKMSILEQYYS